MKIKITNKESIMTLVKWTPRPMNISNDFDDMFRTLFHSDWKNPLNTKTNWKPEIDIKESDNIFQIKADIPGLTKKDIKIYEVGIKYFGRKYSEGKKNYMERWIQSHLLYYFLFLFWNKKGLNRS